VVLRAAPEIASEHRRVTAEATGGGRKACGFGNLLFSPRALGLALYVVRKLRRSQQERSRSPSSGRLLWVLEWAPS